jgi:exopolyphosphatase / guanosine-5'-triphosphate,3'-diphosphate pyrophosphatase
MRVAAVDIGTNTTRLLVGDVLDGHIDEIVRREAVTRLGESVDTRRRLLPAAVARVRNVLVDYRREAERLGAERVLAVATSAVRDAENGEAFLGEVEWSYGFTTRLLSGREEAELTFRGVACRRPLGSTTLVVDVGGGSTELVVGDGRGVLSATSLDIGSVRLTERYLASDPPGASELEALAAHVLDVLPTVQADKGIGVSGTVTTLAALDLGLASFDSLAVDGHRLSRVAAERQLARLARLSLEERRRLPGLEPERAPVIVAGAAIVVQLIRGYALDELETSVADLLDGAALAAAELPQQEEGVVPPQAYTSC